MARQAILATAILVAAVAVSPVSGAEESPAVEDVNDLRTLPAYLGYAALHNSGLKAAFEQWRAALEAVPQAEALPDPRFTYGYFIEEVETRVGPQQQRVGVSQVFPWFGTIEARTDAAAADAKAAQRRYEAAKLTLFYEVKDAFYEYLYLRSAIEIARQNLQLVRHLEEIARTKYVAATGRHPDVIRAQMELAMLEDKLKELQELRNPVLARLNAVLNPPERLMLPWPERAKVAAVSISRSDVIEILRRRNPQLEAKQFEVLSARARIELAKRKFYPDLGVGIDWIDTDEAMASGVSDSGKDPVIVMFSMNLPIWRKSYRAAELQARARARAMAHEREDLENTLIARAERVLYAFDDGDRKVRLYRDVLVPKAEELVGAAETAYVAGTVEFLGLIDAQRTLLQLQLHLERAWADRQQAFAELEMLVGTDLPQAQRED